MISQDTKDQIDRDAESWAFLLYTFDTGRRYGKRGYVEGATNYAEKLEEKDKEIEELKTWHDYYKERAEKGEGILKSATDIHFIPGKEGDNLLAAKDREIEELKADNAHLHAEKFIVRPEELEKAYNELGVKFDKEIERWQERDFNECEKRRMLETELAQLKEITEKMAKALNEWAGEYHEADVIKEATNCYPENSPLNILRKKIITSKEALTVYAEWCKQNLK